MADENLKEYVLLADGLRLEGRRYVKGDTVHLPAETGDRLVESGSLRNPEDPDPEPVTEGAAGLAPVAEQASTLYASQTVDDDGNIKATSFGHPDKVAAAEEAAREQEAKADATKPAAARRRAAATEAKTPADEAKTPAEK
jgi:hypothetical protein